MEGGMKSKSSKMGSSARQGSMIEVMDSEEDIKEETISEDDKSSEEEEDEKERQSKMKNEKTRADEESSEEEDEDDDSDENDSDDDSSSSLGIDLSNYYTKEEADKLLKDQLAETKKALALQSDFIKLDQLLKDFKTVFENQSASLQNQMTTMATETERTLQERLDKMTDDIEQVLRSQSREKSDLQNLNQKLIDRIEVLTKKVDDVNESIESVCTISLCLIESQCMQIRAEEQDEEDKANIALMG